LLVLTGAVLISAFTCTVTCLGPQCSVDFCPLLLGGLVTIVCGGLLAAILLIARLRVGVSGRPDRRSKRSIARSRGNR
jgi:hypothetical protein